MIQVDIITFIVATGTLGRGIGIKKIKNIFKNIPNFIEEYNEGN
jgi:hypothetical protein